MGCSTSREALGGLAPPERRTQGLRSRSLSALSSLGMCRRRNDGGVLHAYVKLPSAGDVAAKGSASVAEKALPVTGKDAASATSSSWTASSPLALRVTAPDLASAILPGLRQIVEDYPLSSSHPSLLYPEHDNPVPPPETTVVVETTCDVDIVVDVGTPVARDIPEVVVTGIVRARIDEFHQQMQKKKKDKSTSANDDDATPDVENDAINVPTTTTPRSDNKAVVVLYFTSLRGVRRTFEDGRAMRAILRCYGVRVDERDVSMHAAFKAELRNLLLHLGEHFQAGSLALPRVFIVCDDGRYCDLGGAEELRALHEAGELAHALAGCEEASRAGGACAACGDARFAVCETCRGSCKVFVDDEGCRIAGCFQQCPDCNENGLIRCPVCCY